MEKSADNEKHNLVSNRRVLVGSELVPVTVLVVAYLKLSTHDTAALRECVSRGDSGSLLLVLVSAGSTSRPL